MTRWRPILVAAVSAILVAALGASATDIGPWYRALHKPTWQPPDWVFGPAWTLIYGLTALAGVLVWNRMRDRHARHMVMGLFALNAALNVGWSELFFAAHRPDWALYEVVPFWLSIAMLIRVCWPVSAGAGRALLPYAAWVLFAGYLNLAVVRLNAPFGA